MPLREWLKPPKNLLVVLFLLTMVAVSSLSWLGWRLLQQERAVANQRTQEQLEQISDQVAANLRGTLAQLHERLSAWAVTPPPDGQPDHGVLLIDRPNTFIAFPKDRLIYWPAPSQEPEAPADVFAEGERLEFVKKQEVQAADWYRHQADDVHGSTPIRAGALMRLGRVLRKLGRTKESVAVYTRLSSLAGVKVAGVPAELAARHELCQLLGRPANADLLKKDLASSRWHLSRGQFEFYWSEAVRLSGHHDSPPVDSVALADAAAAAWKKSGAEPASHGEHSLWVDDKPFLMIWSDHPAGRLLLVLAAESMLPQTSQGENSSWALVDNGGRVVAGHKDASGPAAIRTAAEGRLPWTLYVYAPHFAQDASRSQKRFVLAAVAIVVAFLLAGSYFIARAIRKEIEVSQLQANFVAAVSHEFRSPLTSMRQLSEILAQGRVPSEDRRHMYYETLVNETGRLQRLVETLLDFGRMEAGARRYQLQTLEAAELVKQVTCEFEKQIATSGRHIELSGPVERCAIHADPEAVSVALRNLVDNALKYSPDCPSVWVDWGREDGYVAIRVRDQGAGVADWERKAIFRKFVRGSAAMTGKIKGTGVGLTIASQIVAAHRGQIRMISEPGQGSTFILLLPEAETP